MSDMERVVIRMQGRRLEDVIARDTKLFVELADAKEAATRLNYSEHRHHKPEIKVYATTVDEELYWYLGYNLGWPHGKHTMRTDGLFIEDN